MKSLSKILEAKSKIVDGSTGTDPGVDYEPRDKASQDFVRKHKIEKHDDPAGNGAEVFSASNVKYSLDDKRTKRMGYKQKEAEKVYNEEESIEEVSKKTLGSYVKKAVDSKSELNSKASKADNGKDWQKAVTKSLNRTTGIHRAVDKLTKEETVDEVLSPSTSTSEWIEDFVHSKNNKFKGKCKKERLNMALEAYYGKNHEEVDLTEAEVETEKLKDKEFDRKLHGTSKAYHEKRTNDFKKDPLCYKQGQAARKAGKQKDDNPYPYKSDKYYAWNLGWKDSHSRFSGGETGDKE